MKEVKFRAWVIKGEEMLQDVQHHSQFGFMVDNPEHFVLMQFIGIKDKNGKDIYEGDRLQVAKNRIYEVCFLTEDESGEIIASFGLKSGKLEIVIDDYAIKNGEVIGNIYENPELLKSK